MQIEEAGCRREARASRALFPFAFCNSQLSILNLFVFGVGVFLFFHRLADRDLWSSHEARAGMDAQSVLAGAGPRLFDGRAEVQKPPLYYWLVAGVARLRGGERDEWAVRLLAALAAL